MLHVLLLPLADCLPRLGLEMFVEGQTRLTKNSHPPPAKPPYPVYTVLAAVPSIPSLFILHLLQSSWRYPYGSGVMSGTLHRGGKGFCLLWLHTTLELLREQKLPVTLAFFAVKTSCRGVLCLMHSRSILYNDVFWFCGSWTVRWNFCNRPTGRLFVQNIKASCWHNYPRLTWSYLHSAACTHVFLCLSAHWLLTFGCAVEQNLW